jgi:hypothetical protein
MDLRNFGILPQHYTASQPRNRDLNLHCSGNIKSLNVTLFRQMNVLCR